MFSDDFIGSALDASKWTKYNWQGSVGVVGVANGTAHFPSETAATSCGKYTFTGTGGIVVESRMGGFEANRDAWLQLMEVNTGDFVAASDSNFWGGVHIGGTGQFLAGSTAGGGSNAAMMEYRMTLNGTTLKIERGVTLANITLTHTVTLPSSADGKTFLLRIGTGGPTYQPADFEWVRVDATAGAVNSNCNSSGGVTPLLRAWEARPQNGTWSTANVSQSSGVVSYAGTLTSTYSEYRNVLSTPVSGDAIRLRMRASCNPCSSPNEVYVTLSNQQAQTNSGAAAKYIGLGAATSGAADRLNVLGVVTSTSSGFSDTTAYHEYIIEVQNGRALYKQDGTTKVDVPYAGSLGQLDTISLSFRGKGQFEAASVVVEQLAAAALNGTCGAASGMPNVASSAFCATGTLGTVTNSGANWQWTCNGVNGGASSPTCAVTKAGHSSVTNALLAASVTDSCVSCTTAVNGSESNVTDGLLTTARTLPTVSGSFNIAPATATNLTRILIAPKMATNGLVTFRVRTSVSPPGTVITNWKTSDYVTRQWNHSEPVDVYIPADFGAAIRTVQVEVAASPGLLGIYEVMGFDDGAVVPLPTAISLATSVLRPGITTTIVPTPSTASLSNCISNAPSIATLSAGTVTAVARGDATITCGSASVQIAVRNPRVYSVTPEGGVARIGMATIFTVSGRDLDGPIRFSIEGCDGNGVEVVTPQRPPFVLQPASAVRQFMCVPTGVPGSRRVFVRGWGNPSPDWARGFSNFGTEAPGCDETLFPGCTINVTAELTGSEASASARLALVNALRQKYASADSGEILWDSLSKATVDQIYAALASGGVKTSLAPELEQIRQTTLAAIDSRTTSHILSVGGTTTPYTWKDMVPGSGFWTSWTAYVLADGMTGKDWLKFVGSVSANAALAVGDVLAISSAATAGKIAQQSGKASTGLKRWLKSGNATPKLTKIGNVLEQISTLAETGEGALTYGQLTDVEQQEWTAVLALFKPLAGDALSRFGPVESWLKQGGPAAGLNAPLRKAMLSISVEMLFALPVILADEGISRDALTQLRSAFGEAIVDATPVIGRWKATYEVADRFWERKANQVFGNVHDLLDEGRLQNLQVMTELRLLNLRLLFDSVDYQTGQAALLRTTFLGSQTLPTAGFSQSPSAIKRVVVLTHGWNSSTEAWPRPLLNAFCARRGLSVIQFTADLNLPVVNAYCEGGGWLLMAFNWRSYARIIGGAGEILREPQSALANAMGFGQTIAKDLLDVGIRPELLHAIGHSAGAGLVDTLTIKMKEAEPGIIAHNTYLDAYCPNPYNCHYGASASWAEQYVDSRFSTDLAVGSQGVVGALVTSKMTNVDLPAYNFDVTALDGTTFFNLLGTDDHAWPYRLYGRSADALIYNTPTNSLKAVGPVLSAVWSGQTNATTWRNSIPSQLTALKARCKLNSYDSQGWGAGCSDSTTESASSVSPTRSGAGSVAPNDPTVQSSSCARNSIIAPTSGFQLALGCVNSSGFFADPTLKLLQQGAGSNVAAAIPPATLRHIIDLAEPANELTASATFSGTDSTAVLSLFLNDVLVWTVSARIGNTAQTPRPIAFPQLPVGRHVVQWILTGATGTVDVTSLQFRLRSTAPIHAAEAACGSANNPGASLRTAPISGLCASGVATAPVVSGGYFSWGCRGTAGTSTAVQQCVAGIVTCDRDIDGNSSFDAAIDGILLTRYLMGFRGMALTGGLTIPGPRNTPELIQDFLGAAVQFDVVGRSAKAPTATLDGLLHSRIMQGVPDTALLNGVRLPAEATITAAPNIRANAIAGCKNVN